jgi:hypothetical protein
MANIGRWYDISGVMTLEVEPEVRKLIYITVLWRGFKNLDMLDDPQIIRIGNQPCFQNGTHRAIWLPINGENQIYAQYDSSPLPEEALKEYKSMAAMNIDRHIYSPLDLIPRIPRYLVDDPYKRFSKKGRLPDRFKGRKEVMLEPGFRQSIHLEWVNEL